MKPVAIDADAEHELRQAAARYDAERVGLGGQFVREFEPAVARVRSNPLGYAAEGDTGGRLARCAASLTRSCTSTSRIGSGSLP